MSDREAMDALDKIVALIDADAVIRSLHDDVLGDNYSISASAHWCCDAVDDIAYELHRHLGKALTDSDRMMSRLRWELATRELESELRASNDSE